MTSTASQSMRGTRTRSARRIAAACGVGVLLLGASACGSEDPDPVSQTSTENDSGASTSQQSPDQPPGANGEIAAVADGTAQVQSVDAGQVAVSWTSSTTFTKQVEASLADLKVGDCVMVSTADTGTDGEATQPPAQATEVAATSVRISDPVDGSCTPTGGPGGVPGGGPAGGGPQLQGGGPQGQAPEGQPPAGAQFRGIAGAFGAVKSTSGTGFVVESTRPAVAGAAAETTEVTVTVTAKTTYATTAKGSASDVKVGQCLRAEGQADDTGAIAATTIAITPPVDGECGTFMRRFSSGTGPGNDSKTS